MTVVSAQTQALADITGIVIDRSIVPEKILGQAWLISKSRLALPASTVSLYSEASWALSVRFLHANMNYSVKSIFLHPEFNKREVRDRYLAQGEFLESPVYNYDNDIATMTIDTELLEINPERLSEINSLLTIPLDIGPQELSGTFRGGEIGTIIQNALMTGRSGLLVFYNLRNVPYARLSIKQGRIVRVAFKGLTNELAFCELIWCKPAGSFVLHTQDNIDWKDIPDMNVPVDRLVGEANRRCNELPRVIDTLGGPSARFIKSQNSYDPAKVSEGLRWVAERLWPHLDGYIPISKLSERVGIDTYTILQCAWELRGSGLLSVSTEPCFHGSGRLGTPLSPGGDIDLCVWDPVTAFYIDEASGLPVTMNGNFFGLAHVQCPRTLLHTIPINKSVRSAAVIKDNKLVGIHTAPFLARGATLPPFTLSQMTWLGALSEFSAKRMRTADTADMEEALDSEPDKSAGKATGSSAGTHTSSATALRPPSERPQASEQEVVHPLLARFSKTQIAMAAAVAFAFSLMMLIVSVFSSSRPAPPVVQNSGRTTEPASTSGPTLGDEASLAQMAADYAFLKERPPSGFKFVDTAALTPGKPSFGLESENQNIKLIFALWPNSGPFNDPSVLRTSELPFFNFHRWGEASSVPYKEESLKDGAIFRFVKEDYIAKDSKSQKPMNVIIGAFKGASEDRCIVVIGIPFSQEGRVDQSILMLLLRRMYSPPATPQPEPPEPTPAPQPPAPQEVPPVQSEVPLDVDDRPVASSEEISAYIAGLCAEMPRSFKLPEGIESSNKAELNFQLTTSGKLRKVELRSSSGDADVDKALSAFIYQYPFQHPPKTASGTLDFAVRFDKNKIVVQQR